MPPRRKRRANKPRSEVNSSRRALVSKKARSNRRRNEGQVQNGYGDHEVEEREVEEHSSEQEVGVVEEAHEEEDMGTEEELHEAEVGIKEEHEEHEEEEEEEEEDRTNSDWSVRSSIQEAADYSDADGGQVIPAIRVDEADDEGQESEMEEYQDRISYEIDMQFKMRIGIDSENGEELEGDEELEVGEASDNSEELVYDEEPDHVYGEEHAYDEELVYLEKIDNVEELDDSGELEELGDGRELEDGGEPDTDREEPGTDGEEPEIDGEEPGTDGKEPDTDGEEPETGEEREEGEIENGNSSDEEADDEDPDFGPISQIDDSMTIDLDTPGEPIDISNESLLQYIILLSPTHTLGPCPRSDLENHLFEHPCTWSWRQYPTASPRLGRFRLATPEDIIDLAKVAHECFQIEAPEQDEDLDGIQPVSVESYEQEFLRAILDENKVLFVMVWDDGGTPLEQSGQQRPPSDMSTTINTSHNHSPPALGPSPFLGACLINIDGFHPPTCSPEEVASMFSSLNADRDSPYRYLDCPTQIMTLRGEYAPLAQSGLGDNPVGCRTGYVNVHHESGSKPLGDGSGIYLMTTRLGGSRWKNGKGWVGAKYHIGNSEMPYVVSYFIHPAYFGHNLGNSLLTFVKSALEATGYSCLTGPVRSEGLDFYKVYFCRDLLRRDGCGCWPRHEVQAPPAKGRGVVRREGGGMMTRTKRKRGGRGDEEPAENAGYVEAPFRVERSDVRTIVCRGVRLFY